MSNITKTVKREEALARVIKSHQTSLLTAITRRIRDKIEAEDIAQEVFEEFLASYDLNEAIESIGGWLFTVARNKILDRFRKEKNRSTYREQVKAGADDDTRLTSEPDQAWTQAYQRGEITAALQRLPAEQSAVFVKHEIEGKSFQEISNESGVSVNTLLSRKRYAILSLRSALKEIHDELE